MKVHEIITEAARRKEYLARGLTPEEAQQAIALGLSPAGARVAKQYDIPFDRMARDERSDRESKARRQREDARFAQVRVQLAKLAAGNGQLSPSTVVMIIADDDELFDTIATWTASPDVFEDNPAITQRLEALLRRMKPRRLSYPLWRGEVKARWSTHQRQFHSWTPNIDTAKHFSDGGRFGSRMRKLESPLRGFSLEELCAMRHRVRPEESPLPGIQAEWLVLDPKTEHETTEEW